MTRGRLPDPGFWAGRRVLVTGHTGFKGSWLTSWLTTVGASVYGLSLAEPISEPNLWGMLDVPLAGESRVDIATSDWPAEVSLFDPEVVLHLAAQSVVSVGYRRPADTFRTNVQGTAQVLQFAQSAGAVLATVVVTTDKVYDPDGPRPHNETAPLRGRDPYAASKVGAEMVAHSWPNAGHPIVTARAGNVIGGGDWAADRLLPDLVRAWSQGRTVQIRMPQATRPWQHVLEPLNGYLLYAEDLALGRTAVPALNFGPAPGQSVPVVELVAFAAGWWQTLGPGSEAAWSADQTGRMHESGALDIDSSLAESTLGWGQVWDWREAARRSLRWYLSVGAGQPAGIAVTGDITAFVGADAGE